MSPEHPGGGGAVVHCDGAALAYGRAMALTGVTGEVGPGTALALIGPNGSGKTTLLRGLLGMVDVAAGRIEVCGRAPGRARRGSIGYVPQVADLDPSFPVTVLDVVLMGVTASMARLGALPLLGARRREARRRALAALESVGLAEAAGRRFGTLSGGQQQRVLVARCVAARPRLIALDEPFNGLDQPNRDALLRIIAALKDDGVALVVSTHDLVIARECCEQVALLAGRQIAFGPREEVLVPELIEQAYGTGASGRDDLLLGVGEAR
ncbi:metal ABC transporter ATP-binding protein [Actinomyces timonensis]|uniref:Metal ABC transporter ATP-binding protein n=1 Tax=Actinomyces timonensis TaxID=1288391 RepID=A0AAU8N2Q1_9ACTO